MGNKVNPEQFRLGISVDWKYQLREPLVVNIFISKMVKNMFLQYSAPYVSYRIRRNVNPREVKEVKLKNRMILNPFINNSLMFTHMNISGGRALQLIICLLDIAAEHRRVKQRLRESAFYYLSGKFFFRYGRNFRYFLKHVYNKKTSNRKKLPAYSFFYRKLIQSCWLQEFLIQDAEYQTRKERKEKSIAIYGRKRRKKVWKKFVPYSRRLLQDKLPTKFFMLWKSNTIYLHSNAQGLRMRNAYLAGSLRSIRLMTYLVRAIPTVKRTSKFTLFFLNLLLVCCARILYFLNTRLSVSSKIGKATRIKRSRRNRYKDRHKNRYKSKHKNRRRRRRNIDKKRQIKQVRVGRGTLLKRIFLCMNTSHMLLSNFRYLLLKYNRALFQERFFLFHRYSHILASTLHKIPFITNKRLIVQFYGLHNRNVNAQLLVNYISIKFSQYFFFQEIIRPLLKRLLRLPFVEGFRLCLAGRLSRKERASYIVKGLKAMPLSKHTAKIDYASDYRIMKFGVVGIKVHLLQNDTRPYYYFFTFRLKIE